MAGGRRGGGGGAYRKLVGVRKREIKGKKTKEKIGKGNGCSNFTSRLESRGK